MARIKKLKDLLKKLSPEDYVQASVKVKIFEKYKESIDGRRVAEFLVSDGTAVFLLTICDEEIDKIPVGETIIINKGIATHDCRGDFKLTIPVEGSWVIATSKLNLEEADILKGLKEKKLKSNRYQR